MTAEAPTQTHTGRWRRWYEPAGPSTFVASLVVANLVFRLIASRPGYFWQDDYYIAAWAKYNPLGPEFLFLRFSDHFQPLGLAIGWVSQRLFPGSYPAAMTWTAVLYAASIWVMYRLLLAIFGWRPQILLVLLFWGFSVFTLQSYLWYAASIYMAPYLLLLPLALLAAVRYLARPGPARMVAVFVTAVLVMSAHTFGVTLVVLMALLIAVGAVDPGATGAWWRRVLGHWRLLLVQMIPSVAVILYYISRNAGGGQVTFEPLQSLAYVGRQLSWVVIPGLAGGPWKYNTFLGPEFPFFTPLAGFIVLEFIALLACIAWIRPRAFWFWLSALVIVSGQLVAITLGRGGGDTATILRYSSPGLVALTLAIGLTLMTPPDSPFTWSRWGDQLASMWRGWDVMGRLIIIGVLMQAFIVSFSVSALTPIFESPFAFNKAYMETLLRNAEGVPAGVTLIPQFVPNAVVPVAAPGPTSTQLVLASQTHSPRFADSVSGDLWGFTGDGRLVKQAVLGVEAVGRPRAECVALVKDEPIDVRLEKRIEYPFPTLSVGTIMETGTRLRVELVDDTGVVSSSEFDVDAGLRRTFSALPGQGESLRFTSLAGRLVCVTDAIVGERFHREDGWVQDGSSLPTQSFDLAQS